MKMRLIRIMLVATALILTSNLCLAQVRVTGRADGKSSIDLSGLAAGSDEASQLFIRSLRSDLVRSGWFRIESSGQASLRVSGRTNVRRGRLTIECAVRGGHDDRVFMSQTYTDTAESARRLAQKVADDIVLRVKNQQGIASTSIVLVGDRSGNKELYICDYDGGGLRQLTRDGTLSLSPRWSPDANKIYYTSYINRFPDIIEIDLLSRQRRVVSNRPGLNTSAAVSPDGQHLALILSKDGNPELYTLNLGSGALTRLTRTPRAVEASPSWSPDGNEIVYVSDVTGRPQLYIISRRGGEPRRLRLRGSANVAPDWGPSGWIAYSSRIGGRYQIFIVNPQDNDIRQVSSGNAEYEDPSWAPNGRHIVCSRTEGRRSAISILDIMGDPEVSLNLGAGNWTSPRWSPAN